MRLRCKSCSGVYETTMADGSAYYHVCPPERATLVTREKQRRRVALSDVLPTDRVRVIRDEKELDVVASTLRDSDRLADVIARPRANRRNENTLRHDGDARVIVAEGLGVERLADDPIVEG